MKKLKITKELYDEIKTIEIKPNETFDDKVKALLSSILITAYFPAKEAINFMDILDSVKQYHYDISTQDRTIFVDDKVYRVIEELAEKGVNRTTCLILIKALTLHRMPVNDLKKINAILFKMQNELGDT